MANRFARLHAACEKRRIETNGECVLVDCDGIGWCSYVMEQARMKKGSESDAGYQPGSGEVEAAKHD